MKETSFKFKAIISIILIFFIVVSFGNHAYADDMAKYGVNDIVRYVERNYGGFWTGGELPGTGFSTSQYVSVKYSLSDIPSDVLNAWKSTLSRIRS